MFLDLLSVPLHRHSLLAAAAILVAATTPRAHACSECGCLLSSDWSAQGYPDLPGLTASARFEYYDSDQLCTGRHAADRATYDSPADVELQRETLNRNTWLGLDYVGRHQWAVAAEVPYYDRFHSTVAEGDTELSASRGAGIGDLRVLTRYQQYSMYRSYGFDFGLKLPTGRFDQNFATGPAAGSRLDRGLQLGTGTTDLLLGASYFRRPTPHLGWFAQATAYQPINYRQRFMPSANVALNTGVRYLNPSPVTPQLQLNARWDGREHGANADTPNSGGTLVYVSPGATFEVGPNASAFVFVQVPVYRRVNGLQLEPHSVISIGFSAKL